jgi:hypothetical protein
MRLKDAKIESKRPTKHGVNAVCQRILTLPMPLP